MTVFWGDFDTRLYSGKTTNVNNFYFLTIYIWITFV